jgi:hypothetical protein
MDYSWNNIKLTQENWKDVLELALDEIEFVTKYIKYRFYEQETVYTAKNKAAEDAAAVKGLPKSATAYTRRPKVRKAIEYLVGYEVDFLHSEMRGLYLQAVTNRAFYNVDDFLNHDGTLKEGMTLADVPMFIIDGITRKVGPGGTEVINYTLANRSKALDRIEKMLGIASEEAVKVNINNNITATPAISPDKKRQALLDYQNRLKKLKE